jgi:hypothetical protein
VVIEKYLNHPIMSFDSLHKSNVVNETDCKVVILGGSDKEKEKSFREGYSQELKSKRQQIYNRYQGYNELEDEWKKVEQQMIKTPGRRGEIIKEEEIYKEICRR